MNKRMMNNAKNEFSKSDVCDLPLSRDLFEIGGVAVPIAW
jgi:hypothetical protein